MNNVIPIAEEPQNTTEALMTRKHAAAVKEAKRTARMMEMLYFCSAVLNTKFSEEDCKIFRRSITLPALGRHEKATQAVFFWGDKEQVDSWLERKGAQD